MADKKLSHVLVIPFPVQSHINQMLEFSKSIASSTDHQLKLTFIVTSAISKFAPNYSTPLLHQSSIAIETISDGSEYVAEKESSEAMFKRFESVFSKNLIKFIDEQKGSLFPAKVVVYDSVFPWMLGIAHERDLIGASFFTQSCAASAIYYHVKQGTLKFPYDEDLTVSLPCMPTLGINDLPRFSEVTGSNPTILNLLVDQFSNLENVDWVLFNTFDKLELEVVRQMGRLWPIKTVGPTNLLSDKQCKNWDEKKYTINMFEPNDGVYKEWLDSQETGSVAYVSLGSLIRLDESEMEEIAQGLMMSNCFFLWVVRAEEGHKLHPSFTSLISDRGRVINWCSQIEVLAHPAVGCFLTHGGWNSTIEALSSGVPLIAMPHCVDQTTNSKFIEDVWGVGVRVKAISREDIAACLKEVIQGEKGKELKRNCVKWEKLAKEAVAYGGTTANNIQDFVSTLL